MIRAEEKQQAPQWKSWLNVLDCPAVLRLPSGAITLCRAGCVCTHATFQVCLACCLTQTPQTRDSPCRFGKWLWEVLGSYHKVSSESGGCWWSAGERAAALGKSATVPLLDWEMSRPCSHNESSPLVALQRRRSTVASILSAWMQIGQKLEKQSHAAGYILKICTSGMKSKIDGIPVLF